MKKILSKRSTLSPRRQSSRLIHLLNDSVRFQLLANTFQALGDASRVKIVWLLSNGERHVGGLTELMQMTQPAVSHHLRTLRNLRLVKVRKAGRAAFYSLDDEHIDRLLIEGMKHVEDWMGQKE